MAADSPKRSVRCIPAVVPPQAVSDRSIIDSVAGFINDVTLTNQPQGDPKDSILWARFETLADICDLTFGEDWELEGGVAPPLLLLLGYGSGVQVWAIPANGEAVEVLSWHHGLVRALCILPTPISSDAEMADEPIDQHAHKRPLMALCDSSAVTPGTQFCSINFLSLKDGDQVKVIKFKNPIIDIHANRTSIAVTFSEKIAVFDARNLEDRLTVTTCHPSPGICPNPIALGSRWMAYAERKLMPSKRSSGGCDFDGVSSYTATMLNAAKSFGKGLRELGEQVAAGFTGSSSQGGGTSIRSSSSDLSSCTTDVKQPGVLTILDIKYSIKETSPTTGAPISSNGVDPIAAHFIAHSDAIVALSFDASGMLLFTADKRGHDFHIFRIHPHPGGPTLASVHHLYVLHRGDTSAKVQDIAFSLDSRWVAVSTLRGTTHVFPITPYGGPAGVRTHGSLHVVNRLSRFHRSAGLSVEGRSNSPVFHSECTFTQSCIAYNNPRTPPFPRPTVVLPLAQLRQPPVLGSPPGSTQNSYSKSSHGRQRVSSISDDTGKPLRVCAIFAKARSWLLDPPNATREAPAHRIQRKVVDSLFIMAGHGALIQYDLDAKHASNIPKEKVCDDTPIELEVEAKAQWSLLRKDTASDIQPPLANDNWLLKDRLLDSILDDDHLDRDDRDDRWLSQVEIITHAGPHRRLWMGPQFTFKTYNTPSGSSLNHIDSEAVEIGVSTAANRLARSNPMNMPLKTTGNRSTVPVLIESGSCSSFEQSPRLMDKFRHEHMDSDFAFGHGDTQLKEDLADAMRESPAVQFRETGMFAGCKSTTTKASAKYKKMQIATATASSNDSYDKSESCNSQETAHLHQVQSPRSVLLMEKVVNPLGTVTTITHSPSRNEQQTDSQCLDFVDEYVIHENCDEALFRPVVAIVSLNDSLNENFIQEKEYENPPSTITTELIVPVIEENRNLIKNSPPQKDCTMDPIEKMVSLSVSKKMKSKRVKTIDNVMKNKAPKAKNTVSEMETVQKDVQKCKEKRKLETEEGKKENNDDDAKKNKMGPANSDKVVSNTNTFDQKITSNIVSKKEFGLDKKNVVVHQSLSKNVKEKDTDRYREDRELSKSSAARHENMKKNNGETMTSFVQGGKVSDRVKSNAIPDKESLKADSEKSEPKIHDSVKCTETKALKKDNIEAKAYEPMKVETLESLMPQNASLTNYTSLIRRKSSNSEAGQESQAKNSQPEENKLTKNSKLCAASNSVGILQHSQSNKVIDLFESICDEVKTTYAEEDTCQAECSSLGISQDWKKSKKQKSSGFEKCSPKRNTTQKEELMDSKPVKQEVISFSAMMKGAHKIDTEKSYEANKEPAIKITKKSRSDKEVKPNIAEEKAKCSVSSKRKPKGIDFVSMHLDSIDLVLDVPSLLPLAPFDSKFETLDFNSSFNDPVSLINFESPLQENKSDEPISKEVKITELSAIENEIKSKLNDKNLVVAMCGSLHERTQEKTSEKVKENSVNSKSGLKEKVDATAHSSLEHLNDIDEQYLSLEPPYFENAWTSSSEETEELCCNIDKKGRQNIAADDEELRPLIGGATSVSSITSSSSKKDHNSIALEIVEAIVDTLPINNQSDSSNQAKNSEHNDDAEDGFTGKTSVATMTIGDTNRDNVKHLPKEDDEKHFPLQSSQLNCSGNSHDQISNGKKRLKKKKR